MQKGKAFLVLRHAWQMVGRTLRSYALLSVTIILTFSLFLGYLLYTDASAYNQYKEIFRTPRGMLHVSDDNYSGSQRLRTFLEKTKEIGQTQTCIVYSGVKFYSMTFGESADAENDMHYDWSFGLDVYCLPDNAWVGDVGFDPYDLSRITWLDGKERTQITLAEDEMLLPEQLYYFLGLNEMEVPEYTFEFSTAVMRSDGLTSFKVDRYTLKVVGLLRDDTPITVDAYEQDGEIRISPARDYISNGNFRFVVSQKLMNPTTVPDMERWNRDIYVYTDSPELVTQLARSMDYSVESVYEQQNHALEQLGYQMRSKAIIAAALLLLLGINLYSSFSNVLNERKFEIGVKRALGASSWSIVRQFLYESLIVIAANVLAAIALVADVFVIYKYFYERPDEYGYAKEWIVYISPYSVAMFLVCSVTLTLVFSLVFAYKSTRVEIVKYLKAE